MKNIEFTENDFKGLMFPIYKHGDNIDLMRCPEFRVLKGFGKLFIEKFEDISLDRVLRYIILMYDINSPLHRISILDQVQRKRSALRLAYFEVDPSGQYSESVLNMVIGRNHRINEMIVRFTSMFYLPEYTKLTGLMKVYEKQMKILIKGDDYKDTIKIVNEVEKDMESIVLKIFSGDSSLELSRTLYLVIDEDQMDLSPEGVAKRRKQGGVIVDIDPQNLKRSINVRS